MEEGKEGRGEAGTQWSFLLECVCITVNSQSMRPLCFWWHPLALAASVCVCMHMKRLQVLKMEVSVLNFIRFTDKLKQIMVVFGSGGGVQIRSEHSRAHSSVLGIPLLSLPLPSPIASYQAPFLKTDAQQRKRNKTLTRRGLLGVGNSETSLPRALTGTCPPWLTTNRRERTEKALSSSSRWNTGLILAIIIKISQMLLNDLCIEE